MTTTILFKDKIYQLIKKLQGYIKIDLFYLIKGESWLMLGKTVNVTTAFLLSLAWANWIDKEVYGNYQYIFSLIGIISIFSLPEIGSALTQAVARGFEGSFMPGFKTQLKWGVLVSASALGIASYYGLQGNKNLFWCFLIIATFLPLFNALLIYNSLLTGKKLFNIQVKYDSITQIIAAGIMGSTLFLIKKLFFNLEPYIILIIIISVYFTSRTILRLLFFIATNSRFKPNLKQDPKTIKFGKHLSLLGIVDVISNSLDKILLFHYLGATELAIYFFAILIPEQIKSPLKHIGILSIPKFSIRPRKEIKKTILRKILLLTALITVLVSIYIMIAPFIYQIFFPKYISSLSYSRIYALSIIASCFSLGSVFRAKMMIKVIYQIKIIGPIIKISLFLIFIPLYGIWGAIIAIIIARTFNALLSLYFYRKI